MKLTGKHYMSLGLMIFTAYIIITAMHWPFKTALFPIAIGIPVFCMASALFLLDLFGKEEKKQSGPAVDFRLSKSENQEETDKRTLEIVLWIVGWVVLILLVGFSLSIPIYFIAFLRFRGKEKESWKLTIILAGVAWAFFYGLFIWLLDTPFMDGWVQLGLRALGIIE